MYVPDLVDQLFLGQSLADLINLDITLLTKIFYRDITDILKKKYPDLFFRIAGFAG